MVPAWLQLSLLLCMVLLEVRWLLTQAPESAAPSCVLLTLLHAGHAQFRPKVKPANLTYTMSMAFVGTDGVDLIQSHKNKAS